MQLQNLYIWWHERFHGIHWNYSSHRNWRTPNFMEFHGTARVSEICALQVPWNSILFHKTAPVSEIGALQAPWNSMEFRGTARVSDWRTPSSMEFHGTARVRESGALNVPKFIWNLGRILWNLNFPILMKIVFNFAGCINFRKLISTLYLFPTYVFFFNIYIILYAFPELLITCQNVIQDLFSMLIETYLDPFLQKSMELFEQHHLDNTCGSMEFHGT